MHSRAGGTHIHVHSHRGGNTASIHHAQATENESLPNILASTRLDSVSSLATSAASKGCGMGRMYRTPAFSSQQLFTALPCHPYSYGRYYTYVLAGDGSLRFSETGAGFFTDFFSKHAMHGGCAEKVCGAAAPFPT